MPEAVQQQTQTFGEFLSSGSALDQFLAKSVPAKPATDPAPAAPEGQQPEGSQNPADGSDPSNGQGKKVEGARGLQDRLDEQTYHRRKAERELEEAKEQLRKLSPPATEPAKPAAPAVQQNQPPKFDGMDAGDPEPLQKDFLDATGNLPPESWQRWQDARSQWLARNQFRALQQKGDWEKAQATQAQQTQAAERVRSALQTKFEADGNLYAADHPDYPALVDRFKAEKVPDWLEATIYKGGPELLHSLLKDGKLKDLQSKQQPLIDSLDELFELRFRLKHKDAFEALEEKKAGGFVPPKNRSRAPNPGMTLEPTGGAGLRGEAKSLNNVGSLDEARRLVATR